MKDQRTENIETIRRFLGKNPVLLAATMGFDKKPQLHKAAFCYEEAGVFYFAAAKCESYYGEISTYQELVLGAYDAESAALLRLRGQAVFSEEEEVISRCLKESAALQKAWGNDPGMLIAYFLKDLTAEIVHDDGTREEFTLGTPENVITGITIKKDKELRDRLSRIMEEHPGRIQTIVYLPPSPQHPKGSSFRTTPDLWVDAGGDFPILGEITFPTFGSGGGGARFDHEKIAAERAARKAAYGKKPDQEGGDKQ